MKYISLFAGVGGFDLALTGHQCVYANEWDKYASQVYRKHFGGIDTRDITTVPTTDIPDHELLVGGFPCQAFSVAGKRRGFDDTRGTLFFEIARILKGKQPKYFILENVKGLLSHDGGNTFKTIIATLTDLGYGLQWQVLNSKNFGVPQNRERVFIVGHLRGQPRPEVFPIEGNDGQDIQTSEVREIYEPFPETHRLSDAFKIRGTDGLSATLKGLGGGMGAKTGLYAILDKQGKEKQKTVASTLTGGGHSGGNHSDMDLIAVRQPLKFLDRNQKNIEGDYSFTVDSMNTGGVRIGTQIRRLTPTECERLQGFPDGWTEGLSDTQRYKCLGNAVTVNVVKAIVDRTNL